MSFPSDLAERLAQILDGLRRAAAARAAKKPSAVAVVLLLWPYLHRLAARFDALMIRYRAGRLTPPRPRANAAKAIAGADTVPPRPRLPGGFAWLLRIAPDTAGMGGQVRHWLTDPEVAELLQASPQAGRLLRPLCRMLGIGPSPDVPAALFAPRAPARTAPDEPTPSPSAPASWEPSCATNRPLDAPAAETCAPKPA